MKTRQQLCSRNSAIARSGFTLIEVLLALALCGVVLSAAFSAVHLSWKYRSAGTLQVERSQIMRGVFQDVTLDIRSAVRFPEAAPTNDKLDTVDGMTPEMMAMFKNLANQEAPQFEELSEIEERVLQFDSVGLTDPIHFFGDVDFFVMLSDSENYRFASTAVANHPPVLQQHVVWFSNSGRSLRVPFSVSNGQLQFTTLSALSEQSGLLRMVQTFDARTAGSSNQNSDTNWTRIIPDSKTASFRYFDGMEWRTTWNSQDAKRCPVAVEITLHSGQQRAKEKMRFVVRLPQETGQQF